MLIKQPIQGRRIRFAQRLMKSTVGADKFGLRIGNRRAGEKQQSQDQSRRHSHAGCRSSSFEHDPSQSLEPGERYLPGLPIAASWSLMSINCERRAGSDPQPNIQDHRSSAASEHEFSALAAPRLPHQPSEFLNRLYG
jgi:hypothetical protein